MLQLQQQQDEAACSALLSGRPPYVHFFLGECVAIFLHFQDICSGLDPIRQLLTAGCIA
jgi:hypothetical protein